MSFGRYFSLFLTMILLALTNGCKKREPSLHTSTQTIHLNLKSEPATLDPRKGGDVISSQLHYLLYEGLVQLQPDGSITLAQAQTLDISPDGLIYTFTLKDTVWSDGTPVTAYDFETSWKDILSPHFPSLNAHLFYPIKNAEAAKTGALPLERVGIRAQDAKTLEITLERPTPYFLDLLSFCTFSPVHTQKDRDFPQWANECSEHFHSNGPFVLKEWKHHDEIRVIKNPLYWDTNRVAADAIHFTMIRDEMTALQMFETGQLDMIGEPLSPIPRDALPTLKTRSCVQHYPVGGTTFIAFNVCHPLFQSSKIRKALAYAICRQTIVDNITQMGEIAATNAVPPVLKNNHHRHFFKDADISLAKTLFEEGLQESQLSKEGFEHIVYYYTNSDLDRKVAQAVQQQWKEVFNIHICIEHLEHKVLIDKLKKRDYALAQTLWLAQYNDQMNILERFRSKSNAKNYPHWEHHEYNQLLEASFYQTGIERLETLEKAEEIFLNEMPLCPLYHWEMVYVTQPYLHGLKLLPIGDIVYPSLTLEKGGG